MATASFQNTEFAVDLLGNLLRLWGASASNSFSGAGVWAHTAYDVSVGCVQWRLDEMPVGTSGRTHTPPFVQATVNDQTLTKPTPRVA